LEAFLWFDGLNGDVPIQWQNYKLMKEIFHCTPSELRAQRPSDIAAVLICIDVEARITKAKGQVGSPGLIP
jgi:hypothetical protein